MRMSDVDLKVQHFVERAVAQITVPPRTTSRSSPAASSPARILRAGVLIAVVVIAAIGVGTALDAARSGLQSGAAPQPTPTFGIASGGYFGPTATIREVGGSGLFGDLALRPNGSGDYLLRIYAWRRVGTAPVSGILGTQVSWSIIPGSCPAAASMPSGFTRTDLFDPVVGASSLRGPTAWVLRDGQTPIACADLPIEGARSLEPIPGSAVEARLQPAAGVQLSGRAFTSSTLSGDRLVRVVVDGSAVARNDGATNIIWHLDGARCGDDRHTYSIRLTFPAQTPTHSEFTLVLARDTPVRSLAAYVNGGGELLGCVDLP